MTKFKDGDRVRVRKDLITNACYDNGCNFVDDMVKFKGETLTIINTYNKNCGSARYRVNGTTYVFSDSMLSPITEITKSDLNSGDKAIFRNGSERYVLVETETFHSEDGEVKNHFFNFKDDLNNTSIPTLDIIQVYRGKELVFDREEKSEKDIEIERIESEMRKLADALEKLKG